MDATWVLVIDLDSRENVEATYPIVQYSSSIDWAKWVRWTDGEVLLPPAALVSVCKDQDCYATMCAGLDGFMHGSCSPGELYCYNKAEPCTAQ